MEFLDVFDENNESLGYSLSRKEIHDKNLFHRHVSSWIMNYDGLILLQQRSFSKNKNPGMWAKTGGHVDAGESCDSAIKREVFEEIGLKVSDDQVSCYEVFKSELKENYYTYNYIFFTDFNENQFVLQSDEVEKVKYFSIEELEEFRRKNDSNFTFCRWSEEGFNKQMNYLRMYRDKIKNM